MDADRERLEEMALLTVAILCALSALFRALIHERDSFGTAGWTEPHRDMRKSLFRRLPPSAFLLSKSLFGRWAVLPPRLSARHGFILGPTGSGKTRGYFLPNAALPRKASLVCSNPKGELWRFTSGFHKEAWRFAPADPDRSMAFNWIPLCSEQRVADIAARAVVVSGQTERTEQIWLDLEAAFLSAVFSHASTLSEPTPLSAYRLITERSFREVLETLLASPSESARKRAMVILGANDRVRGSFMPAVAARLMFMGDPAVQRFTSADLSPPDFSALRSRPIAAYWCLPETDVEWLRPLTSVFFTLLLDQVTRMHGEGQGEAASLSLVMLLDEFANVGVIPNFDTISSVARGRGVSLWLGLHSLSQLDEDYGEHAAKTILANMGTKIALAGLDVDSCEYFSRSLGERTVAASRESWHRRGLGPVVSGTSTAESEHGRRLLTADEVRRIREDEAIVIVSNRRPMRLRLPYYDERPRTALAPCLGDARSEGAPFEQPSQKPRCSDV